MKAKEILAVQIEAEMSQTLNELAKLDDRTRSAVARKAIMLGLPILAEQIRKAHS